jgi:putative cardiolipin synthase
MKARRNGGDAAAARGSAAAFAALLLVAGPLLGGCSAIHWDYPRTPSVALTDTAETKLGRTISALPGAAAGESGFVLCDDGIDALALRLMMAERAERSIDTKYYLIKSDLSGAMFVDALLDAADRGVRVRILLDDFLTQNQDRGMRALHAHPNVELRIFNPFGRRNWRFMDAVTSFRRVNRRMHNKSFTVDNQATIIGGRNIGDEYFAASEGANFSDLDVFAMGPVVREVSDLFDAYWNCDRSLPAWAVTGEPDEPEVELDELRGRLATALDGAETSRYGVALSGTILDIATRGDDEIVWCPYELIYDSPEKSWAEHAEEADSILTPMDKAIQGAEREFLVISPYFVLLKSGRAYFDEIVARGVRVRVITNSLAASNHLMVHSGYVPTRSHLLGQGVEVHEVRPDIWAQGAERVGFDSPRATLHTKAWVIDRKRLFLGSFNFDPRSAHINTEMGIILDAPEMMSELTELLDAALLANTYAVTLDEGGNLLWTAGSGEEEVSYHKEPETTWWTRFKVGLMRVLPIKSQL